MQQSRTTVDPVEERRRPPISVVVIGRNEGDRLVRCLKSVRAANYPTERIELIYVDSNSTDDSCSSAERIGAKVVRLEPQCLCAAAARNVGLRAAKHDLIHFLDGDTIIDTQWLGKAVTSIADPAVACVFGRREEIAPEASVYNFWAHHDWYVPPGPAENCAGDALFRREVLEHAGGFDETLIAGEEPDLCYRIRRDQVLTILSLDAPMTKHDISMTRFGQYWNRCMRTGHAYAEVGGRHSGMRRWRIARWRNLGYAVGTPTAVVVSLVLWTVLPLLIWVVWIVAAWIRNAVRLRRRVGTLRGALLYSSHHYIAKLPAALGQCSYWLRSLLKDKPQRLIEYR